MSLAEAQRFHQRLEADVELFERLYHGLMPVDFNLHNQFIAKFGFQHGFDFLAEEYRQITDQLAQTRPKKVSRVRRESASNRQINSNNLERFFIWLSGASPEILASCPESEQKKHAALGGAVLIPALLACITVPFFLYTMNFSIFAIVPVALLWSCMILLMDRALLATYRRGLSVAGKTGQLVLRLVIALLIAITVAHPIVLLLFHERIEGVYQAGRVNAERATLSLQCDLKNPQSEITLLDEKIVAVRNDFNKNELLSDPSSCRKDNALTLVSDVPLVDKFTAMLAELKTKQHKADQDVALFIENAEKEKHGQGENGFTGVRGCNKDSQCKQWLRQASARKDDSLRLGKEVVELEQQITALNQKVTNQYLESKQSESQQCNKERDDLKRVRVRQHEIDQASLAGLYDQRQQIQERCAKRETEVNSLKPDLLTQTEILTRLMFPDGHIAWHNFMVFLLFMLLFLIIDMLAVVLKITSYGIYETKVETAERQHKLIDFFNHRQQLVSQLAELEKQQSAKSSENTAADSLQNALNENFKAIIQPYLKADRKGLAKFFKQ